MHTSDIVFLMKRKEFQRFLFAVIQTAGVLDHKGSANEHSRDFLEGRRSLGLDILRIADAGQPDVLQTPAALATMNAAILSHLTAEEKRNDRSDHSTRYDELPDRDADN